MAGRRTHLDLATPDFFAALMSDPVPVMHKNDLEQSIQRAQLAAVCATLPQGMAISTIIAALLAAVQSMVIQPWICWGWFSVVALLNLIRVLLLPQAKRSLAAYTRIWVRRLEVLTIVAGLVWGASALLLMPKGHPEHQMYLALLLAGMVMGTVMTFSAFFRAAVGFVVLTLSPMLVVFAMQGDRLQFAVAAAGVLFLAGAINGVYRLNHDDRALIRARVLAESSEQAKDEFIANMNHELRTPLTSIVGSLRLLQSERLAAIPEPLQRLVGIAAESAQRMTELVNDLLDMETISHRALNVTLQRIMLSDVITAALHVSEGYAERYAVKFVAAPLQPDAVVNADRGRLLQILANLLSNAAKFSPAGESVTVSTVSNGDRIRIDIIDRGPGIPPAFRERIFQRFSQLESGAARQRGGTGLGLCISKSLADAMNMRLSFDSEVGQGTTFHLHIKVERWVDPDTAENDNTALFG